MGDLPGLLPNATPLVSRFFGKMSKKRQFYSNGIDVNLEKSLRTCPVIVSNNYPRINGKISSTIGDKASIIIDYSRVWQPIKRLCIASILMCTIKAKTDVLIK
jgi:hypothetical protein